MSRPSDRAIAEAFRQLQNGQAVYGSEPGGRAMLLAIEHTAERIGRAAEIDASGDAEPAGVVNWTGEGGTSVTAALYRPLPHGTKLYTRPPVESAPSEREASDE